MTEVRKSEFAKLQGWTASYVSQLAKRGRIVTTPHGWVDVEATRLRIAETADPNRDDVARRHAEERAMKAQGIEIRPAATVTPSGDLATYAEARAAKERAHAALAEIELAKARGSLVDADEVARVMAEAATRVRVGLESFPDRLAPELAAITDQNQIHARLVEEVEIILMTLQNARITP